MICQASPICGGETISTELNDLPVKQKNVVVILVNEEKENKVRPVSNSQWRFQWSFIFINAVTHQQNY